MREFTVLIGEIFFIAVVQIIFELLLDPDKRPQQVRMLNVACVLGSLYLLLQFVFTYIMGEIATFVKFAF